MREYKTQEFTYEEIVDAFHRTPNPQRHFGVECKIAVRGDHRYVTSDRTGSIKHDKITDRTIDFVKCPEIENETSSFGWKLITIETWCSE